MTNDAILCLFLVGISLGLSRLGRYGLERDMFFSALRTCVQLIAVGFVIEFFFELDNLWCVFLLLLAMTMVGGMTARSRLRGIPGRFFLAWVPIATGTLASMTPILAMGAVEMAPRTIIPLAGIVIGGCTKAASLALERISREISQSRDRIEMSLALGATVPQAISGSVRSTVRSTLIPTVDSLKIVGLIHIPGAMTGMILAGKSPLEAVRIQIIIMYMLLFSVFLCCQAAVHLSSRRFFTRALQLRSIRTESEGSVRKNQ